MEAAITYLQTAADTFASRKQWPEYAGSITQLLKAHVNPMNHERGIAIGLSALEQLKKEAPTVKPYGLYGALGVLYSRRNPPEAIAAHEKQLSLLEEVFVQDTVLEFAQAYNDLAEAYLNYQQFDQALQYYLEAKSIASRFESAAGKRLLGDIYLNLGFLYSIMGNNYRALESYQQCERIVEATGGMNGVPGIRILQMIAREYAITSQHRKAIAYAKNILFRIEENQLDGERVRYSYLPYTYTILGLQYLYLEEYDESIHYYQKILDIFDGEATDILQEVSIHSRISEVYLTKGALDSAAVHLNIADELIAGFDENMLQSGAFVSLIRKHLNRKGSYWEQRGEYKKAEKAYREMLGTVGEMEGTAFSFYMDMYDLFTKSGQLDSALYYNQQALIRACYSFEEEDYTALPAASDVMQRSKIYDVMVDRASLKERLHQKPGKEEAINWLSNAIADIDFADELHLLYLKNTNLLKSSAKSLVTASLPIYQKGVELAQQLQVQEAKAAWVDKAFYYAQRKKAQQLQLSILSSSARQFADIPTPLLEQEADLQANIQYYNEQLLEAKTRGDTAAVALYENQYLFSAERALQELIGKMEQEYPDYHRSKYDITTTSGEEARQQLREGELLVEYVLTEKALYLFTLGKNHPLELHTVKLSEQALAQVKSLNSLIKHSPMNRPASRKEFIRLSHAVYRQFLQPIADYLTGKQRLIIIGDGITHAIPFEVLLSTGEEQPFSSLDFLIRRLAVSYHYSTQLFLNSRAFEYTGEERLLAFAPVFDYEQEAGESYLAPDVRLRAYTEEGQLQPLPETEQEVKAIAAQFEGRGYDAQSLLFREQASEHNLKSRLSMPYQYVHIASHSFANAQDPRFSGIACYDFPAESLKTAEDHILYTGEIYNLKIHTELVVLSSCESGTGYLDASEGILGLNRAFMYVGVPNVVFSLWKVYDKVSAQLMADFYQQVLEENHYAASLRAAKLKMLESKATASPHYWAAYLLMGK